MTATPFRLEIPADEVADLRRRLADTRFPTVAANRDFARGTSGEYLRELVAYWLDGYDWSREQARLNEIPQFVAEVTGAEGPVRLHFVHRVSTRQDARPLLLLHGWPDTPFRYRRVLDALAEPEDPAAPAFHVIAPSLPGFPLTGGPARPPKETAGLLTELMRTELGYERFLVGGGDWGTVIGMELARQQPEAVSGLFLTNADYPTGQEPDLSEAEQEYAAWIGRWFMTQGAYAMVQSTKPQIVGPALSDSPAGLAAFQLGLIDTGADDHDVEAAFGDRDELLTNFCLYWFSNTAASAADAYYEAAAGGWGAPPPAAPTVPAGVAVFPREGQSPREWCERQLNLVRYTKMPRGGHFAALEVPDDFVAEVRAFAGDVAGR
ncbi:epoxide hydrolase family protein [Naumannella huperziae]